MCNNKILFVITGLGMGGAENIVIQLADYLAKMGHRVTIIYLTGNIVVTPQNKDVEIIGIGIKKKWNILFLFWKFISVIRKIKPDIVHAHMFHAIILARMARLFIRIPKIICTEHNTEIGGAIRLALFKLTDYLADTTSFVSKSSAEVFKQAGAVKNSTVIYNAIDSKKYYPLPECKVNIRDAFNIQPSEKIIFCTGRLEIIKDYPNLLSALVIIKDNIKFKCLIAGDGTQRKNLEHFSKELGIHNRIIFLGIRHDIAELLNSADLFVLPSMSEGFPLAVAEAMACGSVVVATDCGGVSELIGNAGFLVPARDSKALANAIISALNIESHTRELISKKARQRIEDNYDLPIMLNRYMELYGVTD